MSTSAPQKLITLSTKAQWQRNPYMPHLRRTSPQIYTGSRDIVNKVLSRADFLLQTPETSVVTLDDFRIAFEPQDIQTSSRTTTTDECLIYTSASGFQLRPTFIANDGDDGQGKVFKITFETKKNAIAGDYIGLMNTTATFQDFILVTIDNDYRTTRIIVYRDKEELNDIVTVFRDVSRLSDYASDTIQFIDGTSITPEDLSWYYDMLVRPLEKSDLDWQGVKCPVSLLTSNEDDEQITKIWRPYVQFNVTVDQLLEEETLLFIETKRNVYSIHCRIPSNCTSIGLPAISNNSGLIVKFVSSADRIERMEVLAMDYPFRTSLSGATAWKITTPSSSSSSSSSTSVVDDVPVLPSLEDLPLDDLPTYDMVPLEEIPSFEDIFGDDFGLNPEDIIQSCIRVHTKQWIEGEMEEHPPVIEKVVSSNLNFQGLQKFSLHHGKTTSNIRTILTDGNSKIILRDIWSQPVILKEKSKHRLTVAYVLDGRRHKYKLKFKTSNIHGEHISYLFELPGPLHMHLVLVDHNNAYEIDSIVIDTLKAPIQSDDDDEWASLA